MPIFEPEKTNPIEFIKSFEKYCIRKNISNDHKMLIVEDALIGASKIWFETVEIPFDNFDQFKEDFIDKFFSVEVTMKAKSEWENKRFRVQDKSFLTYFNEQIRRARILVPRMEQHEINFIILNQFPNRVRDILATVDYNDTVKIS